MLQDTSVDHTITTEGSNAPIITDVTALDLPELQALLEQARGNVKSRYEAAVVHVDDLATQIKAENVAAAQVTTEQLQELLLAWAKEKVEMEKTATTAVAQICEELFLRPDISLPDFHHGWQIAHDEATIPFMTLEVTDVIAEIMAYDHERASLQEKLRQTQADIIKIRQQISIWQDDKPEELLILDGVEVAYTLAEIKAALLEAENLLSRLQNRQAQLRLMSLNAVQHGAERLLELGEPADVGFVNGISLADIHHQTYHDWPDEMLAVLEKEIRGKIDQYIQARKSSEAATIAQALLEHWDDSKLVNLLTTLADERDDTRTVLLLLAANQVKQRKGNISLPGDVVFSLLRGVGRLSQKARPFDAISLLAGSLLNGWETNDLLAQFELCIVFAGGQICGQYALPEGILWQLPQEWPLAEMPSWSILWESLLLSDEPLKIVKERQTDIHKQLEQDRHKIQETLTMQDGRYVRVSPIKSDRHRHMLGTFLFLRFQECYDRAYLFEQE